MQKRMLRLAEAAASEAISVRQWQAEYRAGAFKDKDTDTQRAAGWWNWHCRDDALAGRLKLIAPVVMKIKDPFILDHYFVWFMNETGRDKLVYDSIRFQPLAGETGGSEYFKVDHRSPDEEDRWTLYTERFGYHTAEFGCGHVHDMVQYIAVMARDMQQGVRPAFLDEKAAAVEYILRRDTILPSRALRRVGEHGYSFLDRDDGRRKTVHVVSRLEDAPPGFQMEGAVQINGLYVFCPDDTNKTPDILAKSKNHSKRKKSEVER